MTSRKRRPPPGRDGRKWLCDVCHKVAYSSWWHAHWDAREQRQKNDRRSRERVYWSKPCRAYHVGSKQRRKRT